VGVVACKMPRTLKIKYTTDALMYNFQPRSLECCETSTLFVVALIFAESLIVEREHCISLQTCPWDCRRFLRNRSGQWRSVSRCVSRV